MSELLITSSLDPIEEGQALRKGAPRFVTIWQYFELPDFHMNEFIAEAGDAISGFSPIDIVGTENDLFGPNNDTPVRRIRALGAGATLTALHTVLGSVIEEFEGTIRNPEWAYEGYSPHITYGDGRALEKDERDMLTSVELVEKDATTQQKIVRKIWKLEEA